MRRLAVRRHPPSILLEYENESSKLMHYIIYFDKTQQLREDEISCLVMAKLNAKLNAKNVRLSVEQIQPLIKILTSQENENMNMDSDRDLNLLDDSELNLVKARMDKDFEKKKIKPSDTGFVYDTQIDFESGDEDASWDESEEDD